MVALKFLIGYILFNKKDRLHKLIRDLGTAEGEGRMEIKTMVTKVSCKEAEGMIYLSMFSFLGNDDAL